MALLELFNTFKLFARRLVAPHEQSVAILRQVRERVVQPNKDVGQFIRVRVRTARRF